MVNIPLDFNNFFFLKYQFPKNFTSIGFASVNLPVIVFPYGTLPKLAIENEIEELTLSSN